MAASSSSRDTSLGLPNPNRFITKTTAEGRSVFLSNVPEALSIIRNLNGTLFRLGYVTDRPPVSLNDDVDISTYDTYLQNPPPLLVPGGGAVVWYIDTPPGDESPLHRTISLDLVIQLEGEIELKLDSGETRLLRPGDLAIQRATKHAWRNPSKTRWARMLGVMSETQPLVVDNQTIPAELPTAIH